MIQALRSTLAFAVSAAATLVIVAGSAAPVAAAEAPRTAIIDIRGIDLASADGQARVTAEIARTARRVCDTGDNRTLAVALANRGCGASAIASATLPAATFAGAFAPAAKVADAARPLTTAGR